MSAQRKFSITLGVSQVLVVGLLIAAFFWYSRQPADTRTRYPECHPRPLDSRTYCEVLGSDLFAASERLDGSLVSITGFLANDDGVLTLFPNEDAYRQRINTHALVVRAKYEKQKHLLATYGYKYVKVFGKYSSKDETSHQSGKVGSIQVLHADPVRARASQLGPEDLGVNVEDS